MADESLLRIQYQLNRGGFSSSIDLTLPAKGITAIFGTSGSGKTTLLRYIAGLEKIKNGLLQFNSTTWQQEGFYLPTHKRPISYVFQEASLFQHLTVEKNLLFGWKRAKDKQQRLHFEDVVRLLGLTDLLKRYPSQLSGGQRQRAAIARALLAKPELLLMDEPLASLDNESKTEILPYLEKLHEELSIPIIYVSHSVHEVVRIADHIVLIENGKIIGQGKLNALMTDPHLPLAKLEEACAVLEGKVDSHDEQFHLTQLKISSGFFTLSKQAIPLGKSVRIRVLARDVSLTLAKQTDTSINNVLPVEIIDFFSTQDPAHVMVQLNASGAFLLARITLRSKEKLNLKIGQIVYAQIKSVSLLRQLPQ